MTINIKISKFSTMGLKEDYLFFLNDSFNNIFNFKDNVDIILDGEKIHEEKEELNNNIIWNLTLSYQPFLYKKQKIFLKEIYPEFLFHKIEELLKSYQKQKECNHINLVRKRYNERVYPDGEAVCKTCNLNAGKIFNAINNPVNQIIKTSFSKEYVTVYNWKGIYIQCGDAGIVIGPEDFYETAFFEAFPKIDGYSTFIRGEGENPEEAEKKCYEKYLKMIECKNHCFSREVNGFYRKDGAGQCVYCGLFSSVALFSENKCKVCNKSGNDEYKEDYYCFEHYALIGVKEKYNDMLEKDMLFKGENENRRKMIIYIIDNLFLEALKKISEDELFKYESQLKNFARYFVRLYALKILNLRSLSEQLKGNYPDIDDFELNEKINYFINNFEMLLNKIKNKEKIENVYFIK